jgi:hypothetical protein
MKERIFIPVLLVLVSMAIVACGTNQRANMATRVPTPEIRQLNVGEMIVYDFGAIKLHNFNTKNPLGDQAYLLETGNELILIELLAFNYNIEEFKNYIQEIGKPLTTIIVAYHPAGANAFPNVRMYASAGLGAAASVPSFIGRFGDVFNPSLPQTFELVRAGEMEIGGVRFNIIPTASAFDFEIMDINVRFTHMIGSNTHNILPSINEIDRMIALMREIQSKNYSLILSGHDIPRTNEVTAEKIAYLEKTKELVATSSNADTFVEAMRAAFPNYSGENFLLRSATALFAP